MPISAKKIAVIGLGYVGLPLAIALARKFDVIGYDISMPRIEELRRNFDTTGEASEQALRETSLHVTHEATDLDQADVFIVTVPTPVDASNQPDLTMLRAASATVGEVLSPGAIVVFESTVYPGVTEDICGPILEQTSGLKRGKDFFLGYSPERINPGDKKHTVENITKVVAAETPAIAKTLSSIYGAINQNNIFIARDIRTAEAAKVIENAQRDINIAFINEVSMIFGKAGLSVHDVLDAAATKWNFLNFHPGLVGGHCIGVDPFYLAHLSEKLGHHPDVILSGRRINDGMPRFIADALSAHLQVRSGKILVLGLTFKENVPDLRNSKSADLVAALQAQGHSVAVHDPIADRAQARDEYGIDLLADLPFDNGFDCVIGAVAHDQYKALDASMIEALLTSNGLLADIKGMWRNLVLPDARPRWQL